MSFKVMSWASEQVTGKTLSKFILMMLADRSNDEGVCWPSVERLARETEMSERSVVRHIASLEELGLLTVLRRNKGKEKKSNVYQLMIPEVTESHPRSDRVSPDRSDRVSSKPSVSLTNKEPLFRSLFDYYLSFGNLKDHKKYTPDMVNAIKKFMKETGSTIENCKTVIRRHSNVVEITKSNEKSVRARTIQELFGQKVFNASHLIGSEYLDHGKYGLNYKPQSQQSQNLNFGTRY